MPRLQAQVCILNIDADELQLPEDLTRLPYHQQLADDLGTLLTAYHDGTWFCDSHRLVDPIKHNLNSVRSIWLLYK